MLRCEGCTSAGTISSGPLAHRPSSISSWKCWAGATMVSMSWKRLMVPVRLATRSRFAAHSRRQRQRPTGADSARRSHLLARSISTRRSAEFRRARTILSSRALELLRQRSGCDAGARVELVKRIPAAAGLGRRIERRGGRAAAGEPRLGTRLESQIGWPKLAAEIGSDVPFFLARRCRDLPRPRRAVERLPPMRSLALCDRQAACRPRHGEVYRAHDALDGLAKSATRPLDRSSPDY